MTVGDLVVLFIIILLILCVVSFIVGLFIMKKFKSHIHGFNTLFGSSLLLIIILLGWFQLTAADLFMGDHTMDI